MNIPKAYQGCKPLPRRMWTSCNICGKPGLTIPNAPGKKCFFYCADCGLHCEITINAKRAMNGTKTRLSMWEAGVCAVTKAVKNVPPEWVEYAVGALFDAATCYYLLDVDDLWVRLPFEYGRGAMLDSWVGMLLLRGASWGWIESDKGRGGTTTIVTRRALQNRDGSPMLVTGRTPTHNLWKSNICKNADDKSDVIGGLLYHFDWTDEAVVSGPPSAS